MSVSCYKNVILQNCSKNPLLVLEERMQARHVIGSALLVAGMLMAGCGGTEMEQVEQDNLATSEDAIKDCTGQNYEFIYYSDATKTTVVGERSCDCSIWVRWGTTTAYYDAWSGVCN